MTETTLSSARAMTRFRCLGGDCEDTCCSGWTVKLDRATHRRLTVLRETSPLAREMLDESVDFPDDAEEGTLRFAPSGYCSMLSTEGLCRVHAELGPAALFDVCMTYPRYGSRINDRLEMVGALSCPEVARLTLLEDDGLVFEERTDEFPRKLRNDFQTKGTYFRDFLEIRGDFLGFLERRETPFATRLFFAVFAAEKLSAHLFDSCPPVAPEDIAALRRTLTSDKTLGELAAGYSEIELEGPVAMGIVARVLFAHREPESSRPSRFARLQGDLAGRYGVELTQPLSDERITTLWGKYREELEQLPSEKAALLETYLERYVRNHLYATPFLLSRTPFLALLGVAARVAMLRFLIVSRAREATESFPVLVVDSVYAFSRALDHSTTFSALEKTLEAEGMANLAYAVCLTKF